MVQSIFMSWKGRGGGADNFLGGTHDFQGKREGDESVQTEYNGKTTEN